MKESRKFSPLEVLRVYGVAMRKYWLATTISLLGLIIADALSLVTPLYYKNLLDLLSASAVRDAAPLIAILFIILGINLVSRFFKEAAQFAIPYLESNVMNDLSSTAFSNLLNHSYSFFTNNFTGSLVRRITRLSRSFEDVADRFFFTLLPLAVSLIGITIVLFIRNEILGYIFLIWTVLFIAIQVVLAIFKMDYSVASAKKDSEVTGALSDSLSNETAVKLYTGSTDERSRFQKIADELNELRLRAWRFDEYVNFAQGLLSLAVEFALMYAAVKLWQKGILTVGDFVLIQAYIFSAIDQLWNFGSTLRRVYESFADATEMVDIMNTPYEVADAPNATTLKISNGSIEFDNVGFAFNETREVLKNLNLTVGSHEKVALVGPSGAGKSTVTKLLLRLYNINDGAIRIDDQDISKVTQDSLRAAVALVPQEPVLFHRTLMENIRYGKRDATDEEVIEAAKKAHCFEFISRYPEGFETFVGERGVKLSGGERQRVAIARAILKNAPILVLDEATSSLDSESEALIQDALAKLMEGKTVIAIAHRLSTIMKMDRIIVMEDGKVTLSGTHDELVAEESNIYKKLWEIQAGGFIEANG